MASKLVYVFFEIVFCSLSNLLGSILSSQEGPPTLKNRAPASAAARFLKNRRLRSEGGLQSVLGLSWASFGRSWGSFWAPLRCSWGSLGTTLGAATLSNSYCFLSSLPGQTVGKHFESSSCLFLSFLLSFFPSLVRNEDVSCETLLFPLNVEDVSGGNPFLVSSFKEFW